MALCTCPVLVHTIVLWFNPCRGQSEGRGCGEPYLKAAEKKILTEASVRTLQVTPLLKQGDTKMYKKEARVLRRKLKEDRDVLAEVEKWW